MTLFASHEAKQDIDRQAVSEFALTSDEILLKIQERLNAYALILKGGAGLFAASDDVVRSEWQSYVAKLDLQESIPGVQGIGFAQVIPPQQLATHVARIRAEGFPDYTVRPPGERALYTSIVYLEPFRDRNLRAFGFDMFSEPVRRAAMVQARDTGKPALSGKVGLVQESGKDVQAGTLMYVPIYRNGAAVDTVDQRAAALLGWVYSPYRMKDLMDGIFADWKGDAIKRVCLHIYDGPEVKDASLLFESHPGHLPEVDHLLHQQRSLNIHGRQWLLLTNVREDALAISYLEVWATLIAGLAISGLLFALTLSLGRTQARARDIANTLTEEIKQHENLLRESEFRWRFALEGSGDGLWDWNMADGVIFFSTRWKEMLGFSEDEIGTGLDEWEQRIHPQDKAKALATLQACLDGKTHLYLDEHRLLCKDGQYKWILDRGVVVSRSEEGKPLRMIGVHSDTSESKKLQNQMKEQMCLLTTILDTSSVGIVFVQHRQLVWLNQRMAEIFGYTPAEILNQNTRLFYASQESYEEVGRLGYETLSQGKSFISEQEMQHKNGALIWMRLSGKAINAADLSLGSIWIFEDITQQKRDQEALEVAKEAAEAANMAKSRFLATMSHEIRTPMNGILGMAQMLLMPDIKEDDRQDYARTILNSGQTLLMLLNDILDLSKVEAGKVELDMVAFEPGQILHEIKALFLDAAQKKGLAFDAAWRGPTSRRYRGDAHRLRQMLANLVGNAIKFTQQGQVRIEAHEVDHEVECVGEKCLLEFSVSDTGIGISDDKQHLLFQPFSQVDSSTTRRFGGTGLGLSIVRSLAKLMGGEVGIESEPGKGSRFWFRVRLGLVDKDEDTRETARMHTQHVERKSTRLTGRVLVVEDDVTNCKVIEAMLAKLGLSATVVKNGQQCIDLLQCDSPFDLVLMDIQMPVMDGYTATQWIRQWETAGNRVHLPIVALTADAFEE